MNKKVINLGMLLNISTIMVIIVTIISFIDLRVQYKKYSLVREWNYNYNDAISEAEEKISKDKEIWNKMYGKTSSINTSEGIDIERVRNEASEEFLDAIEWAEEKNSEYEDIVYTPFDKEGFLSSYYNDANQIKRNISKEENKIEKIKTNRSGLHLAIILFICQIILVLINSKDEKQTSKIIHNACCLIAGVIITIISLI